MSADEPSCRSKGTSQEVGERVVSVRYDIAGGGIIDGFENDGDSVDGNRSDSDFSKNAKRGKYSLFVKWRRISRCLRLRLFSNHFRIRSGPIEVRCDAGAEPLTESHVIAADSHSPSDQHQFGNSSVVQWNRPLPTFDQ